MQVYAPGFRNSYDILISKYPGREGNLYTIDNGPNPLWGGYPVGEGTANVTNEYDSNEPGSSGPDPNGNGIVANFDGLELIGNIATYIPGSYYGGHPVPIRANPAGAGLFTDDGTNKGWRNDNSDPLLPLPSDWPPVPAANPVEGDYLSPGKNDQSFITFDESVNGLCEYTASGALQGELLAAAYSDKIHRIKLNGAGTATLNTMTGPNKLNTSAPFASGLSKPLDVTAQGDGDIFPGTVWTANYGNSTISVFEPQAITCTGLDNSNDDDADGYTNSDEIDNGTNPCSGADKPSDWDGNGVSDLNDPDDDNDGILDTQDFFALDYDNGDTTSIPTYYALYNYDPGVGFFGLGFSGLMCNGSTDYLTQYNPSNLVAGGAVGAFTVYGINSGDALNNTNTQENAFQFGSNVGESSDNYYTVRTKLISPFFNQNTVNGQSQGLFIGKGDQDNYIKIVLTPSGIQVLKEEAGISSGNIYPIGAFPANALELIFVVNKSAGTVQPYYRKDMEDSVVVGSPISISGDLLNAARNIVAVGAIATSGTSGAPFDGTWDYFAISPGITFNVTGIKNTLISLVNCYLYPNPVTDKINLDFNSDKTREVIIRIVDNSGRVLKEVNLKIPEGKYHDEVFLPHLLPGIYYVSILADKSIPLRTFKIIKQ
ncbi:MAG: T9SS type A sorting domain-containing protein [Cytophagaceae bacterium]|nr:T9SS type A sorting domain-containing protein [Cytophagaceae bacterium]